MKRKGWRAVPVAAVMAVFVIFGALKSGYHIDEIYMQCLSNGTYPPFSGSERSVFKDSMIDRTLTRQEIENQISAADNRFDYKNVYENYNDDNHPPLYGFLLHTVSSVSPSGGGTKLPGLALNFILYALTLISLYALCKKLFESDVMSTVAVLVYGLSPAGLSTALMIRMYILLTLFTVLLMYIVVCIARGGKRFLYPLLSAVIALGLLTQYYFVYYAFFLCAAADVYFLIKKQYRRMASFSAFALGGVICMVLLYPQCIAHLLSDDYVSGKTVADNLLMPSSYAYKLARYVYITARGIPAGVIIAAASAVLIIARMVKQRGAKILSGLFSDNPACALCVVLTVPAFIALVLTGAGNPDHLQELRYVYNLMPVFALAASFLVFMLKGMTASKAPAGGVYAVTAVVCAAVLICRPPDHLYPDHKIYNAALEKYTGMPCVCVTDNYNGPVAQNLMQFMKFKSVFITNDTGSRKLKDYIATFSSAESVVVYVDTDKFWSSGYDAKDTMTALAARTGYSSFEKLYAYNATETYVMRGKQ